MLLIISGSSNGYEGYSNIAFFLFPQFSFQLNEFIGKFPPNNMLHNPIFHNLPSRLLYPRSGKMMDAIGVLSQFENTGAG